MHALCFLSTDDTITVRSVSLHDSHDQALLEACDALGLEPETLETDDYGRYVDEENEPLFQIVQIS